MECVNCGNENLEKALICYWCGLDPATGEQPYQALAAPSFDTESAFAVPTIEVPAPMPVPGVQVDMVDMASTGLTMPEVPSIEIAPPPQVSDTDRFAKTQRRRSRHRPITRQAPPPPRETKPLLPGRGRLLVFVVGLGLLYILGSALVAASTLGNAFCLLGFLSLVTAVWLGLLLVRTGQYIATATGEAYERLELLGRALREVAPGKAIESPANLPSQLGVLDLPVAYSELRYLASQENESPMDLAVDLLTGAIVNLVARDDVVLARRTYPVEVRGALTKPTSRQVNQPVLTRRRVYVGPGGLEREVSEALRTDRPMTVQELMHVLLGSGKRQQVKRLLNWVEKALSEHPPDLDALTNSPDEALVELEQYRQALRRADSELYQLVEDQVRSGLAVVRSSVPSSLLDLARYVSASDRSGRPG
jgi:hypothetical protein